MAKPYERIGQGEALVAGVFLIVMVVMIFSGGVARLVGHPLNWTADIATALFAWACFLAADVAWRRNSMMAIEFLPAALPERPRLVLRMVNYALIAAFLLYLVVLGLEMTWVGRARSFRGIPWLSYSWVTLSLPVGAAFLLATTIAKVRAEWRGETVADQSLDVV